MNNQIRPKSIVLNPDDNVAIVVRAVAGGEPLEIRDITALADVPAGHKIAIVKIPVGEIIRKYGQIIGFASSDIEPGEHVHTHNCAMGDFERDYGFSEEAPITELVSMGDRLSFQGYRRANGTIGTRNYLAVLTSVNCSASVAKFISESMEKSGILESHPAIDGIIPVVHGTGCGMDSDGAGFENLTRTLSGYAEHPNLAGVLMVGLGCEVYQISRFMELNQLETTETFQVLNIQETGGTRKTVQRGIAMLEEMLPKAASARRQTIDASEITLALQCGGSDGYSGITANPALGHAVDLLVAQGGTAILSETPEIYGAEHLLTRRAASREIGEKLIGRINWWQDYMVRTGGRMDNNPSPGNKIGGITTILEKSLGATIKGGTSALNGVYQYGERVTARGLVFMDSPGYDPVSVTGQVASGANVICFTTGRGSVLGCKPVPSIKLATNTAMYSRMSDDMDINCGSIIDGDVSVQQMGQEILDYILAVSSGKPSKSEVLGFGGSEFVPWQIGAVM